MHSLTMNVNHLNTQVHPFFCTSSLIRTAASPTLLAIYGSRFLMAFSEKLKAVKRRWEPFSCGSTK